MSQQDHITDEQLQLLSVVEPDEPHLEAIAGHIETCTQCQQTLDWFAADSELWNLASKLRAEPSIAKSDSAMRIGREHLPPRLAPDRTADASAEDYSIKHLLDLPSHPEMMGRIGGYDIEREVGRGGMGVVFKAFDTELNRPLAIKMLSPRFAENGTARQRFAREARAAAAVLHPNVVAIYGVNSSHETPYLVMPYVAGPSLQTLVDEQGPLEEKEIVRMSMQVAAGLRAAHSQGLVHRDVKPANILVEADVSRVLVTDFGLARAIGDASVTRSGCFVGTPNYMSPEQAFGKRVDARSDLFSLGSVMYFMATGHMPFRAESPLSVLHRISSDEPTPLRQANSDLSKTLSDITNKLLQKDPDDRFQSAGELHEVLEQFLAYLHQPDVSKPPEITAAEPSKYFSTASSVLLAGVLVVALLEAFGVGWFELPARRGNVPDHHALSESQDGASMQSPQVRDADKTVRRVKERARHAEAIGRHSEESARHAAAGQKIQRELRGEIHASGGGDIPVPIPVTPPPVPSPPQPTPGAESDSGSTKTGWLDWLASIFDASSS